MKILAIWHSSILLLSRKPILIIIISTLQLICAHFCIYLTWTLLWYFFAISSPYSNEQIAGGFIMLHKCNFMLYFAKEKDRQDALNQWFAIISYGTYRIPPALSHVHPIHNTNKVLRSGMYQHVAINTLCKTVHVVF